MKNLAELNTYLKENQNKLRKTKCNYSFMNKIVVSNGSFDFPIASFSCNLQKAIMVKLVNKYLK